MLESFFHQNKVLFVVRGRAQGFGYYRHLIVRRGVQTRWHLQFESLFKGELDVIPLQCVASSVFRELARKLDYIVNDFIC